MIMILGLEDDAILNRSVCTFLNDNGFLAKSYLSADKALDAMSDTLILSDIMMPGTDGFAFAERIRQIDQQIPILFMSARDDDR